MQERPRARSVHPRNGNHGVLSRFFFGVGFFVLSSSAAQAQTVTPVPEPPSSSPPVSQLEIEEEARAGKLPNDKSCEQQIADAHESHRRHLSPRSRFQLARIRRLCGLSPLYLYEGLAASCALSAEERQEASLWSGERLKNDATCAVEAAAQVASTLPKGPGYPGLRTAGQVLTGIGGVLLAGGAVIMFVGWLGEVNSSTRFPSHGGSILFSGGIIMGTSGFFLLPGIPLLIIGSRPKPTPVDLKKLRRDLPIHRKSGTASVVPWLTANGGGLMAVGEI